MLLKAPSQLMQTNPTLNFTSQTIYKPSNNDSIVLVNATT